MRIIKRMIKFLPEKIIAALKKINIQSVYELRLRVDCPTMVNVFGAYQYLTVYGASERAKDGIICTQTDIEECIYKAGEYSVYSIEEQIKKGYITTKNGVRLGLAGEYVLEKGQPFSIRKITSLCIRIPQDIVGCGDEIYEKCLRVNMGSLLLNAAPGMGKTTILRDLARRISRDRRLNVLICDERGELSSGKLGATCDVLKFADKTTAFEVGLRALRPDLIVTDELTETDIQAIKIAQRSGVLVLASAHVVRYENLPKSFLETFDYYVFLEKNCIGQVREIFNKNGVRI